MATQAERTAAMRTRLLEATIDCLVTYGYGGATTPRIAERAGVTRGAQIHHFRSKEDLVVAAIDYLAQQRIELAVQRQDKLTGADDPASGVLEYLWESHQGGMFVATVELWVAARTDSVLARHIEQVEPRVNGAIAAAIAHILPDHPGKRELRNALYTAMDALRGILVAGFVDGDVSQARKRWDRASVFLREDIAELLTGKSTN